MSDNTCSISLVTRQRRDGRWSALATITGPADRRTEIRHTGEQCEETARALAMNDVRELVDRMGWEMAL